jgi:hypothetical protein
MKQRQPVNIFNFSFLDVFACSMGIIILVMMILVLQAILSVNPQSREQFDEAKRMEQKLETLEEEADKYEKMADRLRDVESKTVKLETEVTSVKEYLTTANVEKEELSQKKERIGELKKRMEATKRSAAAIGVQLRSRGFVDQTLVIRKPARRKTEKINKLFIIFLGGEFRIIRRIEGWPEFESPHYNIIESNGIVTCRAISSDNIGTAFSPQSHMLSALRSLSPSEHYVECYVKSVQDAFNDFVRVRETIYKMGFDIGLDIKTNIDELTYSNFGKNTLVQ